MKAKTFVVFSATLFFLVGYAVSRVAADETKSPLVSFSSALRSEYVTSKGVVLHDQPVTQNDIFLLLKNGFYADLWISSGLDDRNVSSNYGDELDVTVGWGGSRNKVDIDMGVIYIDGLPTFNALRGDFVMPYAELSRSFTDTGKHTIMPFVKFEWLEPMDKSSGLNSGMYVTGGVKHSWKITQMIGVKQHIALVHDDGVAGKDKGAIGQYSFELRLLATDRVSVFPFMLKTTTPLTSMSDGRKKEMVLGAKVAVSF